MEKGDGCPGIIGNRSRGGVRTHAAADKVSGKGLAGWATSTGHLVARSDTKYDNRGRVYQVQQYEINSTGSPTGSSLTDNLWYDQADNIIQRQPEGVMTQITMTYDSLGRLTTETDPLSAVTSYTYDAASNRISLTDADDNTTTWAYDGIGRALTETNALDDSRYLSCSSTVVMPTQNSIADELLEHPRFSPWRGRLASVTHRLPQRNPVCGDEIVLEIELREQTIHDLRFQARGCFLSQATASVLCERIVGQSLENLQRQPVEELLGFDPALFSMNRRRCVLLCCEALMKLFADRTPG